MKIDVSILQQLAPTYGVQPLGAVPQVVLAINAGASEQAPPEAESILIDAGYTWVENMLAYKNGEQLIFFIAAPQQPFFIWIWKKVLMRAFDTPQKLAKWVSGDEKYPGGKGNKFIELYSKAIGGDDMDRSKGGDITFSGTGGRPDDYQPSKVDPTDALISKLTKQAGPSKKLPSDVMIDVGLKAKKEKNDKLLNFLKTMTPIKEGKLKRSQLETLIKEIVKGILSEVKQTPSLSETTSEPNADQNETEQAKKVANAVWGPSAVFVRVYNRKEKIVSFEFENENTLEPLYLVFTGDTWKAYHSKKQDWFEIDKYPDKYDPKTDTAKNASSQPKEPDFNKSVEDFANTKWKDPMDIGKGASSHLWKVSDTKKHAGGEISYLLTKTKTVKFSRHVIKKGDKWYFLDPESKKWQEFSMPQVNEMSGTSAVAPVSAPIAPKKDVKERKTPDDYANEVRAYRQAIINFVGQDNIEKLAKVYVAHGDDYEEDALPKAFWMIADKLPELGIDVTKLTGKEDKSKLLQWIDSQVKGLPLDEMTTTGDVSGYNIPGAFAKKGGSQKGLEGSAALGFTLTPTGEKEMQRRADKLEEGI